MAAWRGRVESTASGPAPGSVPPSLPHPSALSATARVPNFASCDMRSPLGVQSPVVSQTSTSSKRLALYRRQLDRRRPAHPLPPRGPPPVREVADRGLVGDGGRAREGVPGAVRPVPGDELCERHEVRRGTDPEDLVQREVIRVDLPRL